MTAVDTRLLEPTDHGRPTSYRLVSADSHVIEPAGLWVDRMPRKFQDRAPRTERFEHGDAWVLEGISEAITFGFNAAAGTDLMTLSPWKRWDEIDRAGFDPRARIDAMDADGVDAELLYPSPRLLQYITTVPDDEFHVALVRAYNEWLAEYCSYSPGRLGGLAVTTNRGAHRATAELDAALAQPGMVGAVMSRYPNGTLAPAPEDDELWDYAQANDVALSIHIQLTTELPVERRVKVLPGAFRLWDAPDRIEQLIFTGVLDRYPRLHVVFAEVDCGWLPYFREQLDNSFRRMGGHRKFSIERPPGEYIAENMWFTFITDSFGIHHRGAVGVSQMLWSSDYPHNASDWPNSWRTVNAATADVPADEKTAILAGNAMHLYDLRPAGSAP